MAYNDFVQAIINADTDAITISEIVNSPDEKQVPTRLGRMVWTFVSVNKKIELVRKHADDALPIIDGYVAAAKTDINNKVDGMVSSANTAINQKLSTVDGYVSNANTAINGKVTAVGNTATQAQTDIVKKVADVYGGFYGAFDTLANLQAATGAKTGQVAKVMNDAANNGDYRYTGTAWVKGYDALTDAKNFTKDFTTDIAANNTLQASKIEKDELAVFTDKNGRRTWIEVAKDGGMTNNTKKLVKDIIFTYVDTQELIYAITDKNGRRTWIEVTKTGEMSDATKQHVKDTVLVPVNSPTLAYAVTDKNGRVLTSVSKTGEIYPVPPVPIVTPPTQTTVNLDGVVNYNTYPFNAQPDYSTWAFYGSSWIEQMQNVIYNTLANNIPAIKTPKFYGWGGAEFSYTNLATGFFNGTLTFGGGVIKGNNTATTPTAHTFKYGYPRIGEVRGQLENGIKGKVANGTFTATELTSDFVVPSDLPLTFIADSFKHPNAIALIYHGKNNLNAGISTWQQVVAAARDATAALDSANNKHTLILGFTANTGSSDTDRDSVRNVNKYLKALYGNRFIDVESLVFADKTFSDLSINKTQADIDAIARFTLPPSLSNDPLHLSARMAQYLANHILTIVKQLGWY